VRGKERRKEKGKKGGEKGKFQKIIGKKKHDLVQEKPS